MVDGPSLYCCIIIIAAYKYSDGKKIDGKRVVVDVERGRTVKSWKPRRLGKAGRVLSRRGRRGDIERNIKKFFFFKRWRFRRNKERSTS